MNMIEPNTVKLAEKAWETYLSLNKLELLVGIDRRLLRKKLLGKPTKPGKKGGICYQLSDALRLRTTPLLEDTFDELSRATCSLDCDAERMQQSGNPLAELVEIEAKRIADAISRLQHILMHQFQEKNFVPICSPAPEVMDILGLEEPEEE